VQAPPDKGKANEALLSFLAKELKMTYSCIEIKTGHSARLKSIFLRGCQKEDIEKFFEKWGEQK